MQVFFCEHDYQTYRRLLLEQVQRRQVTIWAYCLMPNHIHLIAEPADSSGLALAVAEAHRRYAQQTNADHSWRGHLWQERFWSFPMSESSLSAVTRYVLLNPVRAGLASRAEDWPFSSARAHLGSSADMLVDLRPLASRITDFRQLLDGVGEDCDLSIVRQHSATGRPLGDASFVSRLEETLGRSLRPGRPGRPRKERT